MDRTFGSMASTFRFAARIRAIESALANNPKIRRYARSVWILTILEVTSIALYFQFTVLSHGVLLVLPLLLLCFVSVPYLHETRDWKKILTTPLYLLFPLHFSRFGLTKQQKPSVKFYAGTITLRMVCSLVFWVLFYLQLQGDVNMLWKNQCGYLTYHLSETQITYGYGSEAPTGSQVSDGSEAANTFQWQESECSDRLIPPFLRSACDARVFNPGDYVACLEQRSWLSENLCTAEACACLMFLASGQAVLDSLRGETQVWVFQFDLEDAKAHEHALAAMRIMHRVWEVSAFILLYLPTIAFGVWLCVSLLLPPILGLTPHVSLSQGLSWMLGSAVQNPIMLHLTQQEAIDIEKRILEGSCQATCKQQIHLHVEFVLLVLDFATDLNCLYQLAVSQQFGVAAFQAGAIILPIVLDCYRSGGKSFQLIEATRGFWKSRKIGFPTDAYIMAFQTEKGVEAPLSFMIQYYTLFRVTTFTSFFSVLCSMPLSIYGISKYIYVNFELGLIDTMEEIVSIPSPSKLPALVGKPQIQDTE